MQLPQSLTNHSTSARCNIQEEEYSFSKTKKKLLIFTCDVYEVLSYCKWREGFGLYLDLENNPRIADDG